MTTLSTVREITDALSAPSPCPLPEGAREHRTVISRTVLTSVEKPTVSGCELLPFILTNCMIILPYLRQPVSLGTLRFTPRVCAALAAVLAVLLGIQAAAQEPELLRGHKGGVFSLAFSPDGELLASGAGDHLVRFWELVPRPVPPQRQRQLVRWLEDLDDDRYAVRQEAFRRLEAEGHQVHGPLLDLLAATKSAEVRVRIRYLLSLLAVPPGVGHQGDVRCVAFSPDGAWVASGSRDNTLRLWRVSSGRTVAAIKAHSDGVWSLAFSPEGTLLASGGGDHLIRLWHPASGELIQVLAGHGSTVQHLVFSPDGRTLASAGGFDRTIRLWDVATGQAMDTLTAHADAVLCVAYSPSGDRLVSAGYDGVLQLWEARPAQQLGQILVGRTVIRAVAFAPPRGDWLAAAGDDGTIRTWDLKTGALSTSGRTHLESVGALVFSADGTRMASGDREGLIRLWKVPPEGRPWPMGENGEVRTGQ
jgi:WD40 repeat protein